MKIISNLKTDFLYSIKNEIMIIIIYLICSMIYIIYIILLLEKNASNLHINGGERYKGFEFQFGRSKNLDDIVLPSLPILK